MGLELKIIEKIKKVDKNEKKIVLKLFIMF
jgi:hypothetical protein